PLALEDLADVLHRGAGIRVGDRDPVDVVLVDGRVLAAEGVVDAAGAAGAEGEVGDEVTLAASSPATAVIAAGGEQSQGRQRAQRRKCPSSDPHRALLFVEVVVTTLVRAPAGSPEGHCGQDAPIPPQKERSATVYGPLQGNGAITVLPSGSAARPAHGVRPPAHGGARRTRSVDGGRDVEGCGVLAGPARQIEVAAGDPADVVARQRHGDLGIREGEVRVMVRLLGGGPDAVDELETGREVAGGEADGEGL